MRNSVLLALLLSTAPFAASAETISGGLTLSYTEHSNDFGEMNTKGLDGRLAVDMDSGLSFGIELGQSSMEMDGIPVDIEGDFYGIDARYAFGNGMSAGLFMEKFSVGLDGIPIELSLESKGLTFGYEGNGYSLDAFVGNTDIIMIDVDNYGISGSYTGTENLEIGAAFHRARLSMGGSSENLDFSGVAATYLVAPKVMVFGGVGSLDLAGLGDLDSMGLGVSYGISPSSGFGASLSLEVGKTSLEDTDLDVIRLGLTIPLGKSGPVLPMNSVADSILNPRRGALIAGLTSGF